MTEDSRISEIRAELDKYDGSGSAFLPVDERDENLLDRIRAILDRQPVHEGPQHDFRVGQRIEFRQWVGGYVLSVNPLRVRSDYTDNPTTNPREIRPEDEDDPLTQEQSTVDRARAEREAKHDG